MEIDSTGITKEPKMCACLLLLGITTPFYYISFVDTLAHRDGFIWNCCYFSLYAGLERKSGGVLIYNSYHNMQNDGK